jgi:endonuclease YncB( thermonuclease family)
MLRNLTLEEFRATCQGRGLWKKRLQHQARRSMQRALGNQAYDRLRAALLGEDRH